MAERGILIVSLDFELAWGSLQEPSNRNRLTRLTDARKVVGDLLACFAKWGIHSTWATVGCLLLENRARLLESGRWRAVEYSNRSLCPATYLRDLEWNPNLESIHFAPDLLGLIRASPYQEVASHTFSHYCCLEEGQQIEEFRHDLETMRMVMARTNLEPTSIVFPRNQYSKEYLQACREDGIVTYRGTEPSWIYAPRRRSQESPVRRAFRLLDAVLPLTGSNTYSCEQVQDTALVNLPSSRFVRFPDNPAGLLAKLREARIARQMTRAARAGQVVHLWWHPHNLAGKRSRAIGFLERIFKVFSDLEKSYGMESLTMGEAASRVTSRAVS